MGTLPRAKTWIVEILTAADLNAEFNNILNNPDALISPLGADLDVASNNFTNVNRIDIETYIKLEATTDPSTAANSGGLYGKDVNSMVELIYREEASGAITQITNSADLVLFNEVFS